MDKKEKKYWVWFSLLQTLGCIKKQKLLKIYKEPINIYNAKKEELVKIKFLGEKNINEILDKDIKNQLEKHIEYIKEHGIKIITLKEKEYPQILKQIYDYPMSIYLKGNEKILNSKSIAIVGCREPTSYGINCAKYFGYNLAQNKICVISGLAKGIDSYSHIGAISSKNMGSTIAVLGNGLDMIYPSENIELANMIIQKGGAIISEYPLGTKPKKMNFPARNRIVSGMSQGVLVIEAKEKSGTLITVDFALEQGKEVYVVPGNINSVCSVGTNRLIKEGAKLVTSYQELL